MHDAPDPAELIDQLSRPEAYPHHPAQVELVETHISWVFLAGDLVYKLKKPVRFEFLDFSSLEKRREVCEDEVRLNQRLAPETYLGVVPITRERDGGLRLGGSGPVVESVVEWAVAMRRLPPGRMLDALLERGEVDHALLDQLVAQLVDFHAAADSSQPERGDPERVSALILGNIAELGRIEREGLAVFSSPLVAGLENHARMLLARHAGLLEQRTREGRIREGHGDLHAANICCPPAGPVIYDCLEFSADFRWGDVALDLAFLAMDLDFRGFPSFSTALVQRYANAAQDPDLLQLVELYKTHRAAVRAKVAALAGLQSPPAEEPVHQRRALAYFQLASGYPLPACMVLMCGLPATGKSWLGPALARALRARWLRSDVRRKTLAGVRPTSHDPEQAARLYSSSMTERTYRSLLEQSVRHLQRGHAVILDATFSKADQRRDFVDAASRMGFPYLVVHMHAEEDVIAERMARRAEDASEVSDADYEVYEQARRNFEPPGEIPHPHLLELDTEGLSCPEEGVNAILGTLLEALRA